MRAFTLSWTNLTSPIDGQEQIIERDLAQAQRELDVGGLFDFEMGNSGMGFSNQWTIPTRTNAAESSPTDKPGNEHITYRCATLMRPIDTIRLLNQLNDSLEELERKGLGWPTLPLMQPQRIEGRK
jgi:hypothetical protein